MVQINVTQIDPDYLGVPGTFVLKRSAITFSSSEVVEAPSTAVKYRWHGWDQLVVHVVSKRRPNSRCECRCGLVSEKRFVFQIHERPLAFRETRYSRERPDRHVPDKWHRICLRCLIPTPEPEACEPVE